MEIVPHYLTCISMSTKTNTPNANRSPFEKTLQNGVSWDKKTKGQSKKVKYRELIGTD